MTKSEGYKSVYVDDASFTASDFPTDVINMKNEGVKLDLDPDRWQDAAIFVENATRTSRRGSTGCSSPEARLRRPVQRRARPATGY